MSQSNTNGPKLQLSAIPVDLNLPFANSPDIIRSNQRDVQSQLQFQEKMKECLLSIFGNRWLNKYTKQVDFLSQFSYYSLTTLLLDQTLGEEYCEILPYKLNFKKLPKFLNRSISILFYCSFPHLLQIGHEPLKKLVKKYTREDYDRLNPTTKAWLHWFTFHFIPQFIKISTDYLLPLHLVIFYFQGSFYHLSKRFTNIRYISPNKPNPNQTKSGYEILGILLGIQLLVKFSLNFKKYWKTYRENQLKSKQIEESESLETISGEKVPQEDTDVILPSSMDGKCPLCLSNKTNPTCTPCGHIFCWECISEWCRTKPECPLCRQSSGLAQLWTLRLQ